MKYVLKGLLTFVLFSVFSFVNYIIGQVQSIWLGEIAGGQFEQSDLVYIKTMSQIHMLGNIGTAFYIVGGIGVLALVYLIWKLEIKSLLKKS